MSLLDAIGWLGSALLIYSVMQARLLRFRAVNTAACVVLTGFNAALGIWPMVAMNVALTLINLWHIRKLLTNSQGSNDYAVLEVAPGETYLRHFLDTHAADIRAHQPGLSWTGSEAGDAALVVLRHDEAVGVVLLREVGDEARVQLDYVTPRFRDFSAGRFVWRQSGWLETKGYRRVITPPGMVGAYYQRLGFRPADDGSWLLER